jgi:hypothetical protein
MQVDPREAMSRCRMLPISVSVVRTVCPLRMFETASIMTFSDSSTKISSSSPTNHCFGPAEGDVHV